MDRSIYSLMLSCDESSFSYELTEKLKELRKINFTGNFPEPDLFFTLAEKTVPDILIIDFEKLTFDHIENISALKSENRLIIISKEFSEIHIQNLLSDIADFIVYKPCTADDVISAVQDIAFLTENGFSPQKFSDTNKYALNKFLQNKITEIIRLAGIPAHITGYNYLRCAVLKCILNMDIFPITKKLYPQLALEFGSTSQKVERAIRHAIEVGWSRSEENTMKHIFGYSFHNNKCKPSNREFIAMVADNIKLENCNILASFENSDY